MKKYFVILLMFWFTTQSFSQLTITPNPLSIQTTPDSGEIIYEIYITNPVDTTYTLFWQFIKNNDWPPAWEIFMCDKVTCYFPAVEKCPNGQPNLIPMGLDTFKLHFNPNMIAATSGIQFKLFGGTNMQNELFSKQVPISTLPSSTNENYLSDVVLFPNPTADYFTLSNLNDVEEVTIYNLYGQQIKSFNLSDFYDIQEMNKGIYLVKIFNSNKQLIHFTKVQKL